MASTLEQQVDLHISEGVPRGQASALRRGFAARDGRRDLPPFRPRLDLRRSTSRDGHVYLADASVVIDGRRLVALASGDTALEAATDAVDRLGRQVRGARERILVPPEWLGWARAARRGWRWDGDTLVRELRFRDFEEGMHLLEHVARRAEDHKRHPSCRSPATACG
jgi:Pterin 4 alpha carbinolamine dehydratase